MNTSANIGETISSLIGTVAVIDLLALILQSERGLSKIRGDKNKLVKNICLGVAGGLFGIYATISGITMSSGAVVSIRDVGPMMAGCIGGPLAGVIAGAVAGIHRLLYGLPDITAGTTIPCSISTLLIGIICGAISKWFAGTKKRPLKALLIAMSMEAMHLFLAFLYYWYSRSLSDGVNLLKKVTLPFMLANGIGFMLLIYLYDAVDKFKRTEDHEKQIESELGVATSIQNDMLPAIFPDFPGRKEFHIGASMEPAKEIGGDFYDFFFVDDDHFAFLVGDVSGKGVPAALFMVISKTIIKNNVQSGMPPAEAMNKANKQLCEGNDANMFVTVWLGVYEISTGELTYVNAGHNPPILKRCGGPAEYLRSRSGFILAGRKKSAYKEFHLRLHEGDRLFIYTDGITEAMNTGAEQYSEERLLKCFSGAGEEVDAPEMITLVKEDVKRFTGDAEQSDDMTMLAFWVSGRQEKLTVPAQTDKFDTLSEFMTERLTAAGVPEAVKGKMNVVLDELFSNVVKYSGSPELTLGVSAYDGHISLEMVYGGTLFDITKTEDQDITLPAKDRPVGGLGLMIVKKTMDTVTWEAQDGSNIIRLTKNSSNTEAVK